MELRNQSVQGADVVMETEGHIASCAIASATRTLRSQSPLACQYVHRTGPGRPSCCPSGSGEEGRGRTLIMHDTRESDNGIVPQKPSNQEQQCSREGVEGRPLTKGNTYQSPAARTQSRGPASRGLGRVRQAAKIRALTPDTRGRSRMREIRSYGSVRGVPGNRHSYRNYGRSVTAVCTAVYPVSSSSNAFASWRSAVSNPSVNQS
jgi:hypothetical protein